MAWPKGKPRHTRKAEDAQPADDKPAPPPPPVENQRAAWEPISLAEANRFAAKAAAGMRERRDAVMQESLAPIKREYGSAKAKAIAPLLRDILDGKPVAGRRPKPLRGPINA